MFDSKAKIARLQRDLATVVDQLERTGYRDGRTDSWLDSFPAAIAEMLGAELAGFETGRRWSRGRLLHGGVAVADLAVNSVDHSITFAPVTHTQAGGHHIILDDDPSVGDLTPAQIARLEQWWRHALTGQRFDPVEAAATLNAL